MKKGLIIALAAVLVLGLSGVAMAWTVDLDGVVDSTGDGAAFGVLNGGGGATGWDPNALPPLTLGYDLSQSAGIIGGTGQMWLDGSGVNGSGWMDTVVAQGPVRGSGEAVGGVVFANQHLAADVKQTCWEIDHYEANSSVRVEGGAANIFLQQLTGLASFGITPPTFDPTTEQRISATSNGVLCQVVDITMYATRTLDFVSDTHVMNAYGENVAFSVYGPNAYQGMDSDSSKMYGYLNVILEYDP